MLALGRKPGQSILIGDDIKITIIKVQGQKVTLGFTAPSGVIILREELLQDETPVETPVTERP